MLISFNWLKQYVDLPDSVGADEVADKLKAKTVEVEKIHQLGAGLDGIVVGKVISAEKHPNADKLKVCQVDLGSERVQIVCGGSNVSEGILVAVAKLGAKVKWHGEGEPIEMKEAEIRGVKSYGMICASTEIGLGEMFPLKGEKEILDLTEILKNVSVVVGKPLADALGLNDTIFEIDNKSMSNRPDLWGHYGMAREVAAFYRKDIKLIKFGDKSATAGPVKLKVTVEDQKLCPRYMAVAVEGIKVCESPLWLAQKLSAVGLRPINNIVDITNYAMYDLGQPMHAFDSSKIAGEKSKSVNIVVRLAKDGEVLKTLDGIEHKLDSTMLVIANSDQPMAMAGIMGGAESGINHNTTTIIFESANFDAATIRRASTKLGLRSDSSARFEKALDPNLCAVALDRALELVLQICSEAKIASKIIDEKHFKLYQGPMELTWDFLNEKIGVEIDRKEVVGILTRLGFEIKEKKNGLSVTVPTWRATKDVTIPEDLVEEILRIYGYENIAPALPVFPIISPEKNSLLELKKQVRVILSTGFGFNEVTTYSFVSEKQILDLGDDLQKYLELDNPLSKEKPFLRRNLLPNLLESAGKNLDNYPEVKIFEIGKVFNVGENGLRVSANSDQLLPGQDEWLAGVYVNKKDQVPYWAMRKVLEELFKELGYNLQIAPLDKALPCEHPERMFIFSVGSKTVGVLHELHPLVAEKYGLDYRVGVLQINLSVLAQFGAKIEKKHVSISEYPEVTRDIAFTAKKNFTHALVVGELKRINHHLLKNVELFDVYEGKTIGDEYKSMAYRLTFGHIDRTLSSEEVDGAMAQVEKVLVKLGAEVRK